MVSNPFLPQRKFENSSMLSGEQSYKKSYVSVRECGCVCLCVFLQADRLPHFLHSIFALVRPSPKGHIVQMTPVVIGVMMSTVYSWNSVKDPADE